MKKQLQRTVRRIANRDANKLTRDQIDELREWIEPLIADHWTDKEIAEAGSGLPGFEFTERDVVNARNRYLPSLDDIARESLKIRMENARRIGDKPVGTKMAERFGERPQTEDHYMPTVYGAESLRVDRTGRADGAPWCRDEKKTSNRRQVTA